MIRVVIADDHPLFRGALREAVSGLFERVDISEAGSFDDVAKLLDDSGDVDLGAHRASLRFMRTPCSGAVSAHRVTRSASDSNWKDMSSPRDAGVRHAASRTRGFRQIQAG